MRLASPFGVLLSNLNAAMHDATITDIEPGMGASRRRELVEERRKPLQLKLFLKYVSHAERKHQARG